MGTSKALLLFDDEPLIVHVVATLQRLFADVVVVAAPEQDLPSMPVRLVSDEVAYQGPVGGIYYGLMAAGSDAAFVTSCDSVFLNIDLIAHLLDQLPEHDVVVPHWQGRFQPLHAVYRRSVSPLLAEQLARGQLRPVYLFDKVRLRRVDEDEIRRFDPEGSSFYNMNTPEDYAEALKRWSVTRRADHSIQCTVELFGIARLLARTSAIALALPAGATFSDAFAALAEKLPALVGRVISADRTRLVDGYACNLNGLAFIRTPTAGVSPGDSLVILSADAGG
jgi:molybdopterin-guanine dinucleotide biosynthesis protein A/molybdopterin converting factor small subunit